MAHDLQREQDVESIEYRLEESEAELRAIVENVAEAIITIDEAGMIQSANFATERIFGYRPDELIGQNLRMLMPATYNDAYDASLRNYLAGGEAKVIGIVREVEGLRKDGSTFPLDVGVSEVNVHGRRLFTGILRDLTEREKAKADLRQREAELAHGSRLSTMGEMVAGISHEVNQPLYAISNCAAACTKLLELSEVEHLDRALECVREILRQATRAGEIIRRLGNFARKSRLYPSTLDINEIVGESVELMAMEMRRYHVRLEVDIAQQSFPLIRADRIQIQQVLVNLLRNACEATQETPTDQRRVRETTSASDTTVQVSIQDNGSGISEDGFGRLFDAFFTTKPDGMGMGLAICRNIITAHAGRLWATSNDDRGMTFHLTLPAAEKE